MDTVIVTGSCGLVGSAVTELLIEKGLAVIGIDFDLRKRLFGADATVQPTRDRMLDQWGGTHYFHMDCDIRDETDMREIFQSNSQDIVAVVHAAGQPSHDWSAQDPLMDFDINARATLILLECARAWCSSAPFVFLSTNKVYGDWVNHMHYHEKSKRWEPVYGHRSQLGVNELAPIDRSMHSPFGCGKVAADLYAQEYGRYFHLPTAIFRCGCITGANHQGVALHGFLAYLAKCVREQIPYTVFGYKGKQVRDNIHAEDLAEAIWRVICKPQYGRAYNMGGGHANSCSVIEAIEGLTAAAGKALAYNIVQEARVGDHKWWVSDTSRFRGDYPGWELRWDLPRIYKSLVGG